MDRPPPAEWSPLVGGMAVGYHGNLEQQVGVTAAMAAALHSGTSCLLRGPFRTGKSTVLRELAKEFGTEVVYALGDDWRMYLGPGHVFVDEAGVLPPEFWRTIPKDTVLCAVLPDAAQAPSPWHGRVFRLDAYRDCPCRHAAR